MCQLVSLFFSGAPGSVASSKPSAAAADQKIAETYRQKSPTDWKVIFV